METCSTVVRSKCFRLSSKNIRNNVDTEGSRGGNISKGSYFLQRRGFIGISVILGTTASYILPVLAATVKDPYPENSYQIQKMTSGVKFQEIVEGEGTEAHEGDLVEFNYVCRRSNGYFVHSTVDQFSGESQPVILHLDDGEIIQGLKEVLVGMKAGGKRRALIPPSAGYINESLNPIPEEFGPRRSLLSHANEPLVFEVQLLKLLNARSRAENPEGKRNAIQQISDGKVTFHGGFFLLDIELQRVFHHRHTTRALLFSLRRIDRSFSSHAPETSPKSQHSSRSIS